MSYGLVVKSYDAGGNELVQIDTTKGLTNYVVTAVGTGTHVNVGARTGKDRRVFIRPARNSDGTYATNLSFSSGEMSTYTVSIKAGTWDGPVMQFVTTDEGALRDGIAPSNAHNPARVDYVIMEDVTGVDPVGDYGLEVLSANTESAFDSRKIKFNVNMKATSIIPSRALGGFGSTSSDVILNNDSSKFVEAGWSFWDDYWTYSGIKVRAGTTMLSYSHQSGIPSPGGTGNINYFYFDNYGPIMIAEKV